LLPAFSELPILSIHVPQLSRLPPMINPVSTSRRAETLKPIFNQVNISVGFYDVGMNSSLAKAKHTVVRHVAVDSLAGIPLAE
jgi:hypothetical protein